MLRDNLYLFISAALLLTFTFCDSPVQHEKIQYGSISGKILHPDGNLTIRILSEGGSADSTTCDPVSRMFTFDKVKYGYYVLEVGAYGYDPFKEKILLEAPQYTCNDIALIPEYGSISGKILYPDSNLTVYLVTENHIDSTTRDPVTQMYIFDSVKTGMCIVQVGAEGYGFHEQMFKLNGRQLICHDIVLAKTPSAVSYLFPSNSQNFDSSFFSLEHASITDSGIQVAITFNDWMDSATLMKVLTILPDTPGVKAELVLRVSLVVFFPYWKLAAIDTARISVGRGAIDRWGDTLNCDYSIFFPVDTAYIRAKWLK